MPTGTGDSRLSPLAGTTTLLDLIRQDPRHSRAWPDLLEKYQPYLRSALGNWGISKGAVEDLGQEVFTSVFRAIARGGGFDPSRGVKFKAYLATVIAHTVQQYLRKAAGGPVVVGGSDAREMLADQPDPLDLSDEVGMASTQFAEALSGEERVSMRLLLLVPEVVEKVKARMKEPEQFDELMAVVIGERTINEAAAALNLKYGNTNQKVFRLRRLLREEGETLLGATLGGSHDQ